MQVSVETTSGIERRMQVSIPAADVNTQITERLVKARKTVQVNGFRKGKVPMVEMHKRFGPGVRQEVMGDQINKSYSEALQQEEIRPVGMPTIDSVDDTTDPLIITYSAVFEVYPTVELTDFTKLKVEEAGTKIAAADVTEMLETLRKQRQTWNLVERGAVSGDTVIVDFVGTIKGEAFEGGTAEKSSIVLGAGSMIPGFEDGIAGMNAGDKKDVKVKFPKDYQKKELQGKAAVFAITMHEVKEANLPKINKDFIKEYGVESGEMAEFKKEVKANMQRELEAKCESFVKKQVMDNLVETHEFDLPKAMVKDEIGRVKKEMFQQYGQQAENIDLSQFPDEPFQEQAERRVKLGLVVSDIITKNELAAADDDVKAQVVRMASNYESPEEVEKHYFDNPELLQNVQMKVLEDQVVAHVLSQAEVTQKSYKYKELMALQS